MGQWWKLRPTAWSAPHDGFLSKRNPRWLEVTVFLRAASAPNRERLIVDAASDPDHHDRYVADPEEFRRMPGSAFVYWVSPEIRRLFMTTGGWKAKGWHSSVGLQTSSDFRFVRLGHERAYGAGSVPFSKGGGSRYYSDVPLILRSAADLHELKAFAETTPGTKHWSRNIRNADSYFKAGITWPRRPHRRGRFSILPSGCAFAENGPVLFVPAGAEWLATAILNSAPFEGLLHLLMSRGASQAGQTLTYDTGYVLSTPLPGRLASGDEEALAALAHRGWSVVRSLQTVNEVSRSFVVPAVLQVDGDGFEARVLAWGERVAEVGSELARVQAEIDELCFELYGISDEDRRAITEGFGVSDTVDGDDADDDSDGEDEAESEVVLDPVGLAAGLVSWAVGVSVGRFDVRLATGERDWPVEPDPFDPLPVCSPGMLTGDEGLPLSSPADGYPVVPMPVLVDDPGHELDLTARVRAVFDVVFDEHADVWWSDVGAALDARNGVEGWLRRGFFDQHLKTYSKSRRKAPIMWPIGTRSGSYRVWLYAHQVTGDTVFRVLGDVVEPKLASEQRRLSDLTQEFGSSPSGSQRRTVDAQQALVDELIELRDELRAVAPLWHPDLNDGIVIVLAPLWRLFAHHRAWSKELRDRWAKLAKGEYDWAQLAMRIWPERVIPKCADDRSLAIAHDLEDTFWVRDDDNPDKWHPRQTPTTPIAQLIAGRANPTIQTARTHPTP